jgi:hypothetical protein
MSVCDGTTYKGVNANVIRRDSHARKYRVPAACLQKPADELEQQGQRARGPTRQYIAIPDTRFFAPELIAVLGHPMVRAATPRSAGPSRRNVSSPSWTSPKSLSAVLLSPPARISPTEGWHSSSRTRSGTTCAASLMAQIAAVTGERPCVHPEPAFMAKLRAASERFTGMKRRMAKLTAVSETMITGTLTRVPEDESVHPVIRDVPSIMPATKPTTVPASLT